MSSLIAGCGEGGGRGREGGGGGEAKNQILLQ